MTLDIVLCCGIIGFGLILLACLAAALKGEDTERTAYVESKNEKEKT